MRSSLAVVVALAVVLSASAGCGSNRLIVPPASSASVKEGLISLTAEFVKDKKDKFDVRIAFRNLASRNIVFNFREVTAMRGTTPTTVDLGDPISERTYQLAPGQSRSLTFICRHAEGQKGDYVVRLGKVYDGLAADGRTPGLVLAENIEWRLAEGAGQ